VDTLGRGTECRCHGSVAAKMSQQALSVPMGHASDLATSGQHTHASPGRRSRTGQLHVPPWCCWRHPWGRASFDANTRSVVAAPVCNCRAHSPVARKAGAAAMCLYKSTNRMPGGLVPTPSRRDLQGASPSGDTKEAVALANTSAHQCLWMGSNMLRELRFPATWARVGRCCAEARQLCRHGAEAWPHVG